MREQTLIEAKNRRLGLSPALPPCGLGVFPPRRPARSRPGRPDVPTKVSVAISHSHADALVAVEGALLG